LGDRKGIWPVKTSASKPLGMAVNVSGRYYTDAFLFLDHPVYKYCMCTIKVRWNMFPLKSVLVAVTKLNCQVFMDECNLYTCEYKSIAFH